MNIYTLRPEVDRHEAWQNMTISINNQNTIRPEGMLKIGI